MEALDSTSPIPRFSVWRAKVDNALAVYGETVLVRRVSDEVGVTFYKRGGTDLEAAPLPLDTFRLWFTLCHKEGAECKRCKSTLVRYRQAARER